MAACLDYHRFETQYKNSLMRVWKHPHPEENKHEIEQFLKSTKTDGVGWARLVKLCQVLDLLSKELGKPFSKVRQADVKKVVLKYEEGNYAFWTRHDIKVILKQFFAWRNKGTYPHCVEWICTTIPYKEKIQVKDKELLTEEEMNRVIEASSHPRDKALISILAESGARVGEIGNLTLAQINLDPNGAVLNVVGKTGPRRIRIISSTPYLVTWLNMHPDRNNSQAACWVNIGTHRYHKAMSYENIRRIIKDNFIKAGITKRCCPYLFRHSRASQMAHHLTEFQMNAYFGWVQGSEMPATYIHISGKDLDDHILRINGMTPGETPLPMKPQTRKCPRCQHINPVSALYCSKCAEIVDPAHALKAKLEENVKAGEPVDRIKSPFGEWLQADPELQHLLKKKLVEFKEQLQETQKLHDV